MSKEELRKEVNHKVSLAKGYASQGNYLLAAFEITQAMKLASDLGDKKLFIAIKKLSVEYNIKAESELQTHTITTDKDSEINDMIIEFSQVLSKSRSLRINLTRIAHSKLLVPRYEEALKNAKEIVPVSAQIVTPMTFGEDGYLKSFDDFEGDWLMTQYNIQLQLTFSMLDLAFARLYRKGQLTAEKIMAVIVKREMYSMDSLLKLYTILQHRFNGDYYSAISLLVPHLEKTFMELSGALGLDTYTFGKTKTNTRGKSLSSQILNSPECQQIWGRDFCILIDLFLYSEDGHKYRHRVAHGEAGLPQYSLTAFNAVFYVFLKMTFGVTVSAKPV